MADMLKFRKGLFADLPETKTAGTIYVTTDEQAMYVDVSASQRVRVGDIIQKNSVREATPPYSTDALYYFIEENALLKWGPFGKDGAMAWKQLNSVSDITADLADVKSRLSDAETAITKLNGNASTEGSVDYKVAQAVSAAKTELQGNIDTEKGRIDALNTTVGGHTTKIESLTTDLGTANTNISANATAIEGVSGRVTTVEGLVGATATEGLRGDVATLKTLVGETEADGLRKDVKANATAIAGIKTDIGADDTSGLRARIKATETKNSEQDSAIAALQTAVGTGADGLATKVDDLVTRMGTAESEIDTLQADVSTNADAITSLKGVIGADDTAGLRKRITDVEAKATNNDTAITKLNGNSTVVGSVDYKIAAAQKTLSDSITAVDGKVDELANGQVATNKTNIEALRSDLNQAQTDISTNAANIQANANAITKLNGTGEGSVSKAVADAKTELQGKIDTANGKITTNTNDIAGLTTRVTAAEGIIANHETLLTKLDGDENTTGSVKAQIKAAKEALSAEIDKDINAANAMNYIGAVATYAALPTEGVHVGDTYVVSTKFTQGSETYHAGDLVVATGDEDDSGVITANLAWNHVKTGYIGEHESKLTGADNALKLTSYLGDDLGTVTFKSASADEGGVVVTVTGNQVSIDFEWGTF